MAQALASPGLFSDDEAAASPVLESTAAGFGADVRKALLSEFSAISPNLEGSQQVRLELLWCMQDCFNVWVQYLTRSAQGLWCRANRDASEEPGMKCWPGGELLLF